jgi:hypothetical protein
MATSDTVRASFVATKVPAGKLRRLILGMRTGVTSMTSASRRVGGVTPVAATPSYELSLGPARPNPSRSGVTIGYTLAEPCAVTIRIYDVAGRLVRTLVDGVGQAGPHEAVWDGSSHHGQLVGAGVFFYRMTTGGWQSQRKVVFLER